MNAYDFLKEEEACRLTPYLDSEGVWTVGWGHNCQATPISQAVADMMFKDDVAGAVKELETLPFWMRINDARQAALLSMRFQMGFAGLLTFRKMLAAIADGDWVTVERECLASTLAKQTPERTRRVARMLATGEWPHG